MNWDFFVKVAKMIIAAYVLFVVLLWTSFTSHAASVIADIPNAATDTCAFTLNGATESGTVPVVQDAARGDPTNGHRICDVNIDGFAPDRYQIRMLARSVANPTVWLDSEYSPQLDFVRSGTLGQPVLLRLVP